MNVHRLHQRALDPELPMPPRESKRRRMIEPRRFGIGTLFRIFRVRRLTILITAFLFTAIAALALTQLTPLYSASALVVVGQPSNKPADIGPLAEPTKEDAAIETQIRVLQSTWLAERAIAKLNLARDPEFRRAPDDLLSRLNPLGLFGASRPKIGTGAATQGATALAPAVLQNFASHLTVNGDGRSAAARVTFTSTNPQKAALIANTIVALYLETQTTGVAAAPAMASDPQLVRLTEQVREAEAALESYKTQGAAEPKDNGSLATEQLAELNTQIKTAKANLAEREEKHRRASALLRSGGDAEEIATLANAPQIAKLREQKTELMRKEGELSAKYGDRHPQMIAIREEKTNLDSKINDELRRIVKSLAGAVTVAKARLTSLETSLNEMQAASAAPAASPEGSVDGLRPLEEQLATRRAALQRYQTTVQPAAAAAPPTNARATEVATPPREPSFPDTPLILGGTLFGSTLMGMLFALVMESFSKGFRAGHEIERIADVSNLAVVPRIKGERHVAERIVQKPTSSFSEAIRSLHSGLLLSNVDHPPKVVVMTSSIPHEGKTSLAVSLGRLAAKGGARVILIDGDLRHPSVGGQFSPRRAEAGLVEVLTGKCNLRDVLHRDPISPLEFIPVAAPPPNPSELLASNAMRSMIEILRQHYDMVIIDAAPVLPVSDTRLLSRLADKMVYVVAWDSTPREAVASGLRLLHDANADIAGTVLNQADMRRHAIYSYGSSSYGYGTKYTRYYAE